MENEFGFVDCVNMHVCIYGCDLSVADALVELMVLKNDSEPVPIKYDDKDLTCHIRHINKEMDRNRLMFGWKPDDEQYEWAAPYGLGRVIGSLYNRGCSVVINSGLFRYEFCEEYVDGVCMLYVNVLPIDGYQSGVDFVIGGVRERDFEKANSRLLKTANRKWLYSDLSAEIYEPIQGEYAKVYVNGVEVCEEPSLLFTYNLKHMDRAHISRDDWMNGIHDAICRCKADSVNSSLAYALMNCGINERPQELYWEHICYRVARDFWRRYRNVIFVAIWETQMLRDLMKDAEKYGYSFVIVSSSVIEDLNGKWMEGSDVVDTLYKFVMGECRKLEARGNGYMQVECTRFAERLACRGDLEKSLDT